MIPELGPVVTVSPGSKISYLGAGGNANFKLIRKGKRRFRRLILQVLKRLQNVRYIAESTTLTLRIVNLDITGFLASNFFRFGEICTFERVLSNISNIGND